MEENWLNKALQNKLSNYDSSMDLEEAWNRLEAKRAPEKKRRFLLFWIFGLGLLCLAGLFYMGMFLLDEHKGIQTESLKTTQSVEKKLNTTLPFSDDKSNVVELREESTNKYQEANAEETKHSLIYTSITKSKSRVSKFEDNNNSKQMTNRKSDLIIEEKLNQLQPKNIRITSSEAFKNTGTTNIVSTDAIENVEINLLFASSNIEVQNLNLEPIISPEIEINDNKLRSQVNLAMGYGLLTNGGVISTEAPIDVMSSSLLYQRRIFKNIFVKTGINLEQYTTKIESSKIRNYTETQADQLLQINSFQDGTQEEIRGMAEVEVLEINKYSIYNTYKFVEIPILLGVSLDLNDRSSLEIESGLSATVFSQYDIKDIVEEVTYVIKQVDHSTLKKRGLVNGLYGIQWNYYPMKSDQWAFFLKYNGQFQFNDISSSEQQNTENFSLHQLMLGTKYCW